MNALGRLGLATAVAEHARQPLSFHIMRYDGRSLVQLAPQDKGPGRVYPVQRQVLRDMLVNMIADSADVIRWDSKIGGYTEGADGIVPIAKVSAKFIQALPWTLMANPRAPTMFVHSRSSTKHN